MAKTTFSGPVVSQNGFVPPITTIAELPAADSMLPGSIYLVNDYGAGGNDFCLVISTGSAWVDSTGAEVSGGGGGGTITVNFAQFTDYNDLQLYSSAFFGVPRVTIASVNPMSNLYTLLTSGAFTAGTIFTNTNASSPGFGSAIELTETMVFDPMAAGGSGAWVGDGTIYSGTFSSGAASTVSIVYSA